MSSYVRAVWEYFCRLLRVDSCLSGFPVEVTRQDIFSELDSCQVVQDRKSDMSAFMEAWSACLHTYSMPWLRMVSWLDYVFCELFS